MRMEFLLTATTRRQIAAARHDYHHRYEAICELDDAVRLALKIEREYPGLVKGPYGSRAISIGSGVTINCLVMRMEDVAPILVMLELAGWRARGSIDTYGYRQHTLSKKGKYIYLECYPNDKGGSKCRRVPTGEMVGGYHQVEKWVCDPEEPEAASG